MVDSKGDLLQTHKQDAEGGRDQDVNDAGRLSQDPAFRLIGADKVRDCGVALTSRLQTFETEIPAEEENLAGLACFHRELIGNVEADPWSDVPVSAGPVDCSPEQSF